MSHTYLDVPTPNVKEYVVLSIHDQTLRKHFHNLIDSLGSACLETDCLDDYQFLALFETCYLRLIDAKTLASNQDLIRTHLELGTDVDPFIVVGKDIQLPFQHRQLLRFQDLSWSWIEKVIQEGKIYDQLEIARYRNAVRECE